MYPVLAAMAAWGERWLVGPEGSPLVLHHTTCDHDMQAVVVCSECDLPLDVREVTRSQGPRLPSRARAVVLRVGLRVGLDQPARRVWRTVASKVPSGC